MKQIYELRRDIISEMSVSYPRGSVGERARNIRVSALKEKLATTKAQSAFFHRWVGQGRPQYWLGRSS